MGGSVGGGSVSDLECVWKWWGDGVRVCEDVRICERRCEESEWRYAMTMQPVMSVAMLW